MEALDYTIDPHRMRISTTEVKVEAIRLLLEREWASDKNVATAQEA